MGGLREGEIRMYKMSIDTKKRIEQKYRAKRVARIEFLEQQLQVFQSDLNRFKLQLEEARLVENVKGR
jgi:hypothetical protein